MLLVDKDIRTFILNGTSDSSDQISIESGDVNSITPIGYDLLTHSFAHNGRLVETCELQPGESVFAQSKEIIHFDSNTVGKVS